MPFTDDDADVLAPAGVRLRDPDDSDGIRSDIEEGVMGAMQKYVNGYEYGGTRLELSDMAYADKPNYSIAEQQEALMRDSTLARRLRGTVSLVDVETNKPLEVRKNVTLARVPYLTQRGTMIHNGSEYAPVSQSRLLPGAYTRRRNDGALEVHFNTRPGSGSAMRMALEPTTGQYRMMVGTSNVHAYSVFKDLGVTDDEMERRWGPEVLAVNKKGYDSRAMERAYMKAIPKWKRDASLPRADKAKEVLEAFSRAQVAETVLRDNLPNLYSREKAASWREQGKLFRIKEAAMMKLGASRDMSLITHVPTAALDYIRAGGLLSGDELAKPENRHLLELARPGDEAEKWLYGRQLQMEETPWTDSYKGPSAFFGEPDPDKIHDKHPSRRFATVPVRILLSKLMADIPSTRVRGSELTTYAGDEVYDKMSEDEKDAHVLARHRDLDGSDIRKLIAAAKNPKEFWKHNNDPEGKRYAADVPHAQVVVPGGRIHPRYLDFGDSPKPPAYREGGSFTHDGQVYDLDRALASAGDTRSVPVSELAWLLEHATPDRAASQGRPAPMTLADATRAALVKAGAIVASPPVASALPTAAPQAHHRYLSDDDEHETYASIGVDGLLAASEKLLAVNRGLEQPDHRDAAANERVFTVDRLMAERVKLDHGKTLRTLMGRLSRRKNLSALGPAAFDAYTVDYLKGNPTASAIEEINPMSIMEQRRRITKMGAGGIGDRNAITPEMQAVDASQFGFISTLEGPECFDSQSEVYTTRGWTPWPDVTDDDEFACCVDGRLEWHRASRIIRAPYSGELIVGEHETIRMAVTPTHRVLHRYSTRGRDLLKTAHQVYGKSVSLPCRHAPSRGGNGSEFVVCSKQWDRGCLGKFTPEELIQAPLADRQRMFGALMGGDWTHTSKSLRYRTLSYRLAQSVERLAVSLGYSAYMKMAGLTKRKSAPGRPYYNVRIIRGNTKILTGDNWRTENYTGVVYCATVPGGLLHVRGKKTTSGFWSGNSEAAGIDVRLAHNARIGSDGRIYQRMRNNKTGKLEWVSAMMVKGKTLRLPD